MYCEYCGKKLDDNAKFCENCGEIVDMNYNTSNKMLHIPKELIIVFFGLVGLLCVIFVFMNKSDEQEYEAGADYEAGTEYKAEADYEPVSGYEAETDYEVGTEYESVDGYGAETEYDVGYQAESDDVSVASFGRVYDYIGVLNEEDRYELEEEYYEESDSWQCDFCVFYINDITEYPETQVYNILRENAEWWDDDTPNIIYVYENATGIMYTYSSTNSMDMLGEYTRDYIESETEGLIHCVPEDSNDYRSIGGVMLNPFFDLSGKLSSDWEFTREYLENLEDSVRSNIQENSGTMFYE